MTVVIVDHDLDRVLGYADRLLVLDRAGRVLADGDPTAVTATHWAAMAAAGVRLPVAFRVRQALVAAGASARHDRHAVRGPALTRRRGHGGLSGTRDRRPGPQSLG